LAIKAASVVKRTVAAASVRNRSRSVVSMVPALDDEVSYVINSDIYFKLTNANAE
jgi:hypothetical protein